MPNKLYMVKVETEIMVVANSEAEASRIAQVNASGEINTYCECHPRLIKSSSEVAQEWTASIPYSVNGTEHRTCAQIAEGYVDSKIDHDDVSEIIKIKEASKPQSINQQVNKQDIAPSPTPKEMDWQETKSGRPMPKLRFIR